MTDVPEDLFARIAVKNSLVTEEQLSVARTGSEQSGKPLWDVLVVQEAMTRARADSVLDAIRRKMAQKAGTPPQPAAPVASPPATPSPKVEQKLKEKSGIEHEYEQNEEHVKRLIRHLVTSLLHQRVLEQLVKGRISVVDPTNLSRRIGAPKKDIVRVLKRWQRFKCAAPLGGGTYNFNPGDREAKTINLFLRCWSWPPLHAKLMSYVLEQGKK